MNDSTDLQGGPSKQRERHMQMPSVGRSQAHGKAGGSVSHGDSGIRGGREIGLVLVAKERSSDFSINGTESHC